MKVSLRSILLFLYKNINFKLGALGGIVTASWVYWLNSHHGFDEAIWASVKQFIYTILVGGTLTRIAEKVCVSSLLTRFQQYALAIIIPTGITFLLLSAVHFLKGTPEPLPTIIYTTLLAPLGFFIVALLTRHKLTHEESKP